MRFAYLMVDVVSNGRCILSEDRFNIYIPNRKYVDELSSLIPYLGNYTLAVIISESNGKLKLGTVIATMGRMTLQNWIIKIPCMNVSGIGNNKSIVNFLALVRTSYNIDINKTKVTLANLKRVKTHLESFTQSTKEIEWLLNTLPVLEFLYNKYGQEIK